MKNIAAALGYLYILATILAMAGVIDMYVCVGKPGACVPTRSAPAPVKGRTT